MIALTDAADVHPAALVTVKLYVAAESPVMVLLVPVPVIAPGLIVHVPVAGRPVKFTLPVAVAQVGWVIVPTVGADGVAGWGVMTTLADAAEVHPVELVTVKL
jgi:hypothetical protein